MDAKLASKKDLSAGKMVGVESGGQKILLANVGGSFYAIGNVCTHRGCSLSEGILKGDQVECPCHGSIFDVKTGAVIRGPASKPEKSFKVSSDGDALMVTV